MELEIPDNVKNLRLDPGEVAGGLILRKLVFENDIKADFTANGFPVELKLLFRRGRSSVCNREYSVKRKGSD